ncbi:MAG TPA: aspartate/glutamate racemase family protein [Amaricoccus sp.]|jgi:allantoin racemase|uniref:aspartate/glutamate racemase family protein n=1 Tax=Amaricoccus sp. TaxID=1872485 RepID=UPI002BB2A628|nr:aspartate/glutamate racemase family protein [Amaricoccus sp.]HMR14798.1 aspartate/glutamate racemase family protein [Arachnia sp.]HMR53904.1 aspartate/glutamate racemase family protein [Amaricoccus sp.]HMU00872.1 aspartate/glutamate racemase family protein [Amaricoccus sp.]
MPRIRVLSATTGTTEMPSAVKGLSGGGLELSFDRIRRGPASIESLWEEAACVEDLVRCALVAQEEGIEGLVVNCMGDPGVDVMREILTIPVFGPAQTAMGVAAMLGRKFCVLTVLDRSRPLVDDQVRKFGLESRYAGCEVIEIPVLDFGNDPDETLRHLHEAARAAVETRKADVLVLGCTGWTGLGEKIRVFLAGLDHDVPVIDPLPVTIRTLGALLEEGLAHSKTAYPFPKAIPEIRYSR